MKNMSKRRMATLDITVFAVLGAIMFLSKIALQLIPNVHLLGLFIAAITLTYGVKALIPIYVFVLLDGVVQGFSTWWIPNLYIWLPLWASFMIVGKFQFQIPRKIQVPLYMALCALHGLSFGALFAPVHALFFRLSFQGMIAWIMAGIPFDIIHAVGNAATATLIVPMTILLRRLKMMWV